MSKLTAATVLRQPSTGQLVFLPVGTELPGWAAGLVGDHILDVPTVTAEPNDGQVTSEIVDGVIRKIGDGGSSTPDGDTGDESDVVFDPGKHTVEEVIAYLSEVRATEESPDAPAAELARVTEAEKAGKDRSTLVAKLEQAHIGNPDS